MQLLRTFPLCTGGGSLATYYSSHYICDTHWNTEGAFAVCEELCEVLGNPQLDFGHYAPVGDQWFCGDVARSALYPLAERVFDTTYDFSDLEGRGANGAYIDFGQHQKYEDANPLNRFYNFYGLYYELDTDATITGGVGHRNTLLVGDSFARSLTRPLAESSATLFQSAALFRQYSNRTGLREHLVAGDIDSVVFVGTPADIASFVERNPDFF